MPLLEQLAPLVWAVLIIQWVGRAWRPRCPECKESIANDWDNLVGICEACCQDLEHQWERERCRS